MSREIKDLISRLEQERDEIQSFFDELEAQLERGEITSDVALAIIREQYGSKDPQGLITLKNHHITEAHDILHEQRKEVALKTTPVLLVILIGIAIVWNFTAITGLFTAENEQFYQIGFQQTVTETTTLQLAIDKNISSLRIDGLATGTGTANVWLLAANTKFLVATFAPVEGTPLTGFVVDEGDTIINDTNMTNDTILIEPVLNDTTQIDLVLNETISEGTEILPETTLNETIVAVNDTSQEILLNDTITPINETTVVEEILVPIELPPASQEPTQTPRELTFVKECQQTCDLPNLEGPFQLLIEITGDTTVTIDTVTYGERLSTAEQPPQVESNATALNNTPSETPDSALTKKKLGEPCGINDDCESGSCRDNNYHGILSSMVCTPAQNWCVADTIPYPPAATKNDSVCLASATDSVWLAMAGNGRFAIKNTDASIIALMDKYGSMAVAGIAQFSSTPTNTGWVLTNEEGTPVFSLDATGSIIAAANLTERTTPQPAGKSFIIKDQSGAPTIVITQAGSLQLTGDIITGTTLA